VSGLLRVAFQLRASHEVMIVYEGCMGMNPGAARVAMKNHILLRRAGIWVLCWYCI
jgi:hypothetical protein